MAILSQISKAIVDSTVDWVTVARKLGFDKTAIQHIESESEPTDEFVKSLTLKFWEDILNYFNIYSKNKGAVIPGIIQVGEILSKNKEDNKHVESNERGNEFLESNEEKSSNVENINLMNEIAQRIAGWEVFARVLEFTESYIKNFDSTMQDYFSGNVFEKNTQRNIYLMIEALKKFNAKNIITDPKSWRFWRHYLEQFQEGRDVIEEMETYFPTLLADSSINLVHEFTSSKMTYIGHPIQHKPFNVDKTAAEIPVNIGSNKLQMTHFQNLQEWSATKERYMDIFSLFVDKIVFNFHDLQENCPILNTLEEFINDGGGNGFAAKGYQLVNHTQLFTPQYFIHNRKFENYFCFLEKEKMIINFTKCGKEPGHAFHYSSQNLQIMNALHEELQSKDITQVNVLVHDEDENIPFCKGCIKNDIYINETVLKDIEKLKLWFKNLQKSINQLQRNIDIPHTLNENMLKNIKKDMITHEALQNSEVFPSFSALGEDQMNEMPKVIMLTGVQFTILRTSHPFIFIRGSYGSGKSIVLQKKFDNCVDMMSEKDLAYYICHDQQSKYMCIMNNMKRKHNKKHIITCNSASFSFGKQKPTLTVILNHILEFWKKRIVHVFIDEFSGSSIDKEEIEELERILPKFPNSQIVISLQSMEENIHEGETEEIDLGYGYDLLEKNTQFVVYDLDSSLRCSVEINEFVKATSTFIEEREVSTRKMENFYDDEQFLFVDKEYGEEFGEEIDLEKEHGIQITLTYNVSEKHGHHSCNGPVSVYAYDKFKRMNKKKSMIPLKSSDVIFPLVQFYITTLEHILNISEDETFVICTFDEQLYNSVYFYLLKGSTLTWTHEIEKFIEVNSNYNILLSDYASVRGCEFQNFIFLLRMGTRYLKYRTIECFTRATNKLYIITDNINTTDKSLLDNQLIRTWKNLPCVKYFDCKYNQSKDTLQILQGGELIHSKTHLRKVPVGAFKRFPWSQPKKVKESYLTRSNGDLYWTICYLCMNDNIDILREFFQLHQLDFLDYSGYYDESLLHISADVGGINISQYLISQCGVDVNARDCNQRTPLHYASRRGHTEVAQFLFDNKANIHSKDNNGWTPLHWAANNGHSNTVQSLIDNKADTDAKDFEEQTPRDKAERLNKYDIVELIEASIKK